MRHLSLISQTCKSKRKWTDIIRKTSNICVPFWLKSSGFVQKWFLEKYLQVKSTPPFTSLRMTVVSSRKSFTKINLCQRWYFSLFTFCPLLIKHWWGTAGDMPIDRLSFTDMQSDKVLGLCSLSNQEKISCSTSTLLSLFEKRTTLNSIWSLKVWSCLKTKGP